MLTALTKEVSLKVVGSGGIVRSVQNHGIRDLPHRFRAKYPDTNGNRYFTKGRFISIYYDSNPSTMQAVDEILSMHQDILRKTHLRARNKLDQINVIFHRRNPYIRKVLRMEKEAMEAKVGRSSGKMTEEEQDAMLETLQPHDDIEIDNDRVMHADGDGEVDMHTGGDGEVDKEQPLGASGPLPTKPANK